MKTFLRPDMYEFHTLFSPEEISWRARSMSFAEATLLIPYNVRSFAASRGFAEYFRYLRLPPERKRQKLISVLLQVGFTARSAEVITKDRHLFTTSALRNIAYMNRSVPISQDTNLSTPSLVAYMLEATSEWCHARQITEVGIGTGLHAIAMAEYHPQATLFGVERNELVYGRMRSNVSRAGLDARVVLVNPEDQAEMLRNSSHVYVTAALSLAQLDSLVREAGPGTTWLVPRALTREEFETEPNESWLRRHYLDYLSYQESEDWNEYCVVEEFRVEDHGERVSSSKLYDVMFVKFIEEE